MYGWSAKRVVDPETVLRLSDDSLKFTLHPDAKPLNNGFRQELTSPLFFHNGDQAEFEMWTRFDEIDKEGVPSSLSRDAVA